MKIVTSAQMREIDQMTIGDRGIPGLRLMENAGRVVVQEILSHFLQAKTIGIICGKGNNGGDGLVCARHLIQQNRGVVVFLLAKGSDLKGDAKSNLTAYLSLEPKPTLIEIFEESQLEQLSNQVKRFDVLVDAILGTGTSGVVRGMVPRVIDILNNAEKPIVSIDMPTGLDADRGLVLEKSIHPALTVSLGLPKIGLVTYPGAKFVGKLVVADIGIPDKVIQEKRLNLNWMAPEEISLLLPKRDPESHKGSYGHVLLLGGSPGYTGAAALASTASLRMGAGLVTLGVPVGLQSVMATKVTEVMTFAFPETQRHTFSLEAEHLVLSFLKRANVLAIGPGMSTQDQTLTLVQHLIHTSSRPMVIDADALTAIAHDVAILKTAKSPIILTPHPGEMARLIRATTKEIQLNRIGIAQKFARENNVYLVLKGARTVIAEPTGQVYINPTGNAGMATGGSGDILTGMIAGLLAQGLTPLEACLLGTYLHGYTGDLAKESLTEFCIIASDLLIYLPKAIQYLQNI